MQGQPVDLSMTRVEVGLGKVNSQLWSITEHSKEYDVDSRGARDIAG